MCERERESFPKISDKIIIIIIIISVTVDVATDIEVGEGNLGTK